MTEETIIENCKRLCDFLKHDLNLMPNDNQINCIGLLHLYGKIMDDLGAPKSGWGYLFLKNEEFDEMVKFVKEHNFKILSESNGQERILSFFHNFYNWHIVNR